MTDTELDQIVGRVVREHEAAKKHLAALKAQGEQIAEFICRMAATLADSDTRWRATARGFTIWRPVTAAVGITGEWPSVDVVTQLLQDLDATKARLADLAAQRKDLGV